MRAVVLLMTTEAIKSVDSEFFHSSLSYRVIVWGINRQQNSIPFKMKLFGYWEEERKKAVEGSGLLGCDTK